MRVGSWRTFQAEEERSRVSSGSWAWVVWVVMADQEGANVLRARQGLIWVTEGSGGVTASCVLWEAPPCVLSGGG